MPSETPSLPPTGYVRLPQIIAPLGPVPVSRSTIWRWVREKKFPKPIKLSKGVTVWSVDDVREWISDPANDNG